MAGFDIHSIEPMVLTAEDRDLIDKAIKANNAKKTHKGDGSGVITDWSCIDGDGKVHKDLASYCYAGMSRPTKGEWKFIVARMMHDGGVGPGNEARHAYINYIINRSPYSSAFVAQDLMLPDDIEKRVYGYNVCRTDVPANLISGGLTAIRMAWEFYGQAAEIWHRLTQAGCDEDLAYAFAFQVRTINHKQITIQAAGEGHSSWDGKQFTEEMLANYINWHMSKPVRTFLEQASENGSVTYYPICTAWGIPTSGSQYYYGEDISFLCGERQNVLLMMGGDNKKSSNPFKKNIVKSYDAEKFCNIWAGVIMQKCEHLLAKRGKKEKANVA